MDIDAVAMKVKVVLEGLDEAASAINSFMQQMKAASDSVTAVIQAGANQGKAAVQEAAQEMAASTETNSKEQKEAYGKVADAALKAYKGIGAAINESIAELNKYTIAMNGLEAAAKRQGLSSAETIKTMNGVTDAIFGATDGATALGHLLDSGLGADKAANLLNRFKETAALSRTENISFTDSIVAAAAAIERGDTQGLKAIGIMKTQSDIQKEYAASVGLSVDQLTESMKMEAVYQGIMTATASMVGDYATFQQTLAGSQERAIQSGEQLAVTFGDSMAPAVQLANDMLSGLYLTLDAVAGACPPLTAGVTTATTTVLGLVTAIQTLSKAQELMAKVNGIGGLFGGLSLGAVGGIAAAIGGIVALYTGLKKVAEETAAAEAKAYEERQVQIANSSAEAKQLTDLANRYDELSGKARLSYSEMKEKKGIEETLSNMGVVGGAVDTLTGKYKDLAEAAREAADEAFDVSQGGLEKQEEDDRTKYEKAVKDLETYSERAKTAKLMLAKTEKAIGDWKKGLIVELPQPGKIKEWEDTLTEYEKRFGIVKETATNLFSTMLTKASDASVHSGTPRAAANTIVSSLMEQFNEMIGKEGFDFNSGMVDNFQTDIEAMFESLSSAVVSSDASNAIIALEGFKEKYSNGMKFTDDDIKNVKQSVSTITNEFYWALFNDLAKNKSNVEASDMAANMLRTILGPFMAAVNDVDMIDGIVEKLHNAIDTDKLTSIQEKLLNGGDTALLDASKKSYEEAAAAMKTAGDEIEKYANAKQLLNELEEKRGSGTEWDDVGVQALVTSLETAGVALKDWGDIEDQAMLVNGALAKSEKEYQDIITSGAYAQAKQGMKDIVQAAQLLIDTKKENGETDDEEYKKLQDIINAEMVYLGLLENAKTAAEGTKIEDRPFDAATANAKQYQKEVDRIAKSYNDLKKYKAGIEDGAKAWGKQKEVLQSVNKNLPEYKQALLDAFGTTEITTEQVADYIKRMDESYSNSFDDIASKADSLDTNLLQLAADAGFYSVGEVDLSQAQAASASFRAELFLLKALMDALGIKTGGGTGGKGGGGGKKSSWYDDQIKDMEHLRKLGQLTYEEELAYLERLNSARGRLKKDEQTDLDERLYQAREDVRQKAIDDDYAYLDHKKHMNEMDLTQELAYLETMKAAHTMNAEELTTIEEKLYDVREAIRQKALEDDYAAIDHRKAMEAISLEEELAALEAIRAARDMNVAESLAYEERVYALKQDIRRKNIEDDYGDMEHEKRMGRLSYQEEVEWLERIRDKHQMTAEEQRQIEEELYDAREQYRQALLQGDYSALEHRKRMGEMTLEQELETLQAIKAAREMNAEELLEMEEKLYAQEQSIRSRDAGSITKLMTSLTKALSERYKEMRDEETALLKASKEGWKDWADENVKAIQDQIDALDALLKKEDSDATDEKELKQIASLREQIQFEQDEYNRRQLQAQLDKALEDRETRLRKEAIEAEKAALKEKQEAIKEEAKAQQEALDGQIDEIKTNYEERLKAAALQAEAERLILSDSQDAILALLKDYEADYNATGQTLGEALLDGFIASVGDVDAWFEAFNTQYTAAYDAMKEMALEASARFEQAYRARQQQQIDAIAQAATQQAIIVNQSQTFNQPVESAADVARRVQLMNEELGKIL